MALSSTSDWARDVRSPAVLIAQARDQLHEAEGRVADLILRDPEFAVQSTVSQLAAAAGTSDATVVRFCRTVGFRGYPELRLSLARDMTRQAGSAETTETLSPGDAVDRSAFVVFAAVQRSLADTMEIQQAAVLERAVERLARAGLVLITGDATRAAIVHEAERRLTSVGVMALAAVETGGAAATLGRLGEHDVLLVLPGAGTTTRMTRLLEAARARGG